MGDREWPESDSESRPCRRYFVQNRPDEFWQASELIDQAGQLLADGNIEEARDVLIRSNSTSLRAWRESLGFAEPSGRSKLAISKENRDTRLPNATVAREIFQRDGWHCRYCGQRVIEQKIRSHLRNTFGPEVVPLKLDTNRHSAIWVMGGSLDHVIPHAHGGRTRPDNLVTTCNVCQHHRRSARLEDHGIYNPFDFSPILNSWDGLWRVLQ